MLEQCTRLRSVTASESFWTVGPAESWLLLGLGDVVGLRVQVPRGQPALYCLAQQECLSFLGSEWSPWKELGWKTILVPSEEGHLLGKGIPEARTYLVGCWRGVTLLRSLEAPTVTPPKRISIWILANGLSSHLSISQRSNQNQKKGTDKQFCWSAMWFSFSSASSLPYFQRASA